MNYQKKFYFFLTLFTLSKTLVSGQEVFQPVADTIRPGFIVGTGAGLMTFYGDVGYKKLTDPFRFKLGGHLSVERRLNPFLNAGASLFGGRLYGNDKSVSTFNNFQANLFGASLNLTFYPLKTSYQKIVQPYIQAGIGGFYFQSYSDLKDINNIPYYYWSDNTIKNLPENDPNASKAVNLGRDYTYETSKNSGIGLAVPVGIGVTFQISNKLSMNLGPTWNIMFTDNVDNVSDGKPDSYVYASATIRYDFAAPKYSDPREKNYEKVDFMAIENQDTDGDGIIDKNDRCPGTPVGEKVDTKGCPMDDDGDGVPNYLDKEPNTVKGAVVDEFGVELTEEYLAKKEAEKALADSLGADAPRKEVRLPTSYSSGITYKVKLGAYKDGIPPELVDKFLAIPDVVATKGSDSITVYTVGPLNTQAEAEAKRDELINKGIKKAEVIATDRAGNPVDVSASIVYANVDTPLNGEKLSNNPKEDVASSTPVKSGEVEYKVQLGAFGKSINENAFKGINVLTKEPIAKGYTRYLAGSFNSPAKANAYRDKLRKNGFENAFTVAYKDGKRLDGAPTTGPASVSNSTAAVTAPEIEESADNDEVVYKVQIGAFKEEVAPEKVKQFKDIQKEPAGNGLTRYLTGSFKSFEEAFSEKDKIAQDEEFKGAFVAAYKGGKRIRLSKTIPAKLNEEVIKSSVKAPFTFNKENIVFKVQLGKFRSEVPTEILSTYLTLPDVDHQVTPDGMTRFTSGSFKSYEEAKKYKDEVESKGVKNPFIIAMDGDKVIPLQDAVEALKEKQ